MAFNLSMDTVRIIMVHTKKMRTQLRMDPHDIIFSQ